MVVEMLYPCHSVLLFDYLPINAAKKEKKTEMY